MLGAERQQHGVVAGRRLQLEVERQAELLAQGQAERAVHARAERGVHDELHAARLVEEALEHDVLVRRQHAAQRCAARLQVIDDQRRGHLVNPRLALHARDGGVTAGRVESLGDDAAQARDLLGELIAATRRLAQPEGDRGMPAGGVAHAHHAVCHLRDLPRVRAQQKHVALHRLDREVLVHGPDEHVAWLHQHAVVARLGNRSPRGQRRQPCAAARAQASVDAVAV